MLAVAWNVTGIIKLMMTDNTDIAAAVRPINFLRFTRTLQYSRRFTSSSLSA